jgi:hypothetical protein
MGAMPSSKKGTGTARRNARCITEERDRRCNRPFNKPETGKIAVKVINHYGDEVLKVFQVG